MYLMLSTVITVIYQFIFFILYAFFNVSTTNMYLCPSPSPPHQNSKKENQTTNVTSIMTFLVTLYLYFVLFFFSGQ